MKFSLSNLGCKVNRVEADTIGATLVASGWQRVDSDADVVVVNTCTVTSEADRKTRKEVHRALARNPYAHIVVTGCAAAIDPNAYEALSERVRVVPKNSVIDVCLSLDATRCLDTYQDMHSSQNSLLVSPLRVGEGFPTRVGVKVQDGCDNACTYCIVHVARGKATSVPLIQCVDEVVAYSRAGVREVILTGIDLGAYQYDGQRLPDLIRAIREAAPSMRLRISSIEPNTLSEDIVELLASADGMVCRHLHVPLQSGSSKVLHEMARRYTAQEYLDRIERLRKAVPSLSLSTDIIVGFPGETDDDFAQTVDLARMCGFSRMHIFRYSRREGTPAAARLDQVASSVKADRFDSLSALAASLRSQDAKRRIGSTERVLVESSGRGMSESYYDVCVPEGSAPGTLEDMVLHSYSEKDGCFYI